MDFRKFAEQWEIEAREMTIHGYTISSCNDGVESTLFAMLKDANSNTHYLVCNLLNIRGVRLERFAALARQMLDAEIKTLSRFGTNQRVSQRDVLYIESCEVLARCLGTYTENVYASEDHDGRDRGFPWYGLSKKVIDEFGGIVASLAAVALGGIALAIILIRNRRYQYAWCAAMGVERLASYATGHLLSEDGVKRRFAKNAVANRKDQLLKPMWLAHCKKAVESGRVITQLEGLFQIEGCPTDFKKHVDARTLKRWAKEVAGIEFKPGRPKK